MPRKKRATQNVAPHATSPLPERFEEFAKQMADTAPAASDTKPDPQPAPFVAMEETTWSGRKMWRCPQCASTTFDQVAAETHTCKRIKWADEAEA